MTDKRVSVETAAASRVCSKCSAEVREGSEFCYNCGTKITLSGIPTATVATTAGSGKPTKRKFTRPERPTDYVWKRSDGPGTGLLVTVFVIAILVAAIIGTAFYLK